MPYPALGTPLSPNPSGQRRRLDLAAYSLAIEEHSLGQPGMEGAGNEDGGVDGCPQHPSAQMSTLADP